MLTTPTARLEVALRKIDAPLMTPTYVGSPVINGHKGHDPKRNVFNH